MIRLFDFNVLKSVRSLCLAPHRSPRTASALLVLAGLESAYTLHPAYLFKGSCDVQVVTEQTP